MEKVEGSAKGWLTRNFDFLYFSSFQGLDTSFFLAPSGHRFTSINLAQNFANVLLKKEKVAKAIKEDEAKIKHKISTRAGKRKAEEDEDFNSKPEAKKLKLEAEKPVVILLSQEVMLRR